MFYFLFRSLLIRSQPFLCKACISIVVKSVGAAVVNDAVVSCCAMAHKPSVMFTSYSPVVGDALINADRVDAISKYYLYAIHAFAGKCLPMDNFVVALRHQWLATKLVMPQLDKDTYDAIVGVCKSLPYEIACNFGSVTPKCHGLLHIPEHIRRFGVMNNTSMKLIEREQKYIKASVRAGNNHLDAQNLSTASSRSLDFSVSTSLSKKHQGFQTMWFDGTTDDVALQKMAYPRPNCDRYARTTH